MKVVSWWKKLKFNKIQIKAIADLLLEIGKWLLLAVVLNAIFLEKTAPIDILKVISATICAIILILVAVLMLRRR